MVLLSDILTLSSVISFDICYFNIKHDLKQSFDQNESLIKNNILYLFSDDIFLSDGTSFDGVAPEDLALASVDTSIAVTVSFGVDVIMLQDLIVEGLINDVDVVEVNRKTLMIKCVHLLVLCNVCLKDLIQ